MIVVNYILYFLQNSLISLQDQSKVMLTGKRTRNNEVYAFYKKYLSKITQANPMITSPFTHCSYLQNLV